MQQVEGTLSGGAEDPSEPKHPGFLSPGRAFLLLLIALAIAGVWLWTGRESPPPDVATETEPRVLTDAEAIATFERLHELFLRSYHERDTTLISLYAAPDAPTLRNPDEIKLLLKDGVVDKTKFVTKDLEVLSSTPDEIVIKQTVLVEPRFLDEKTGEDLTSQRARQEQTVEWTMRLYSGEWRLYRRRITDAEAPE